MPFSEGLRGLRAPGIVAVVVGPDDLIEREIAFAAVPAGKADVVGVSESLHTAPSGAAGWGIA